jgi:hypothetical protein
MTDLRINNTLATYGVVGAREDLTDVVWEIGRKQVPFLNAIRKGKATAMYHEWEKYTLAVAGTNAHQDGEDIAFQSTPQPTRLGNRVQILEKDIIVSDLVEVINKAGRKSEIAMQMRYRTAEIKRDLEKACLSNTAKVTASAGTASKLGGVPTWLTTNTSIAADGTLSAGDGSTAYTPGTARDLAEAYLTSVMQSCFSNSGEAPSLYLVSPGHKVKASGFNGNQTRMADAKSRTIFGAIRVYESDFGELDVVPDAFQPTSFDFVLNPAHWALCTLQPLKMSPLAKTGMAEKSMITWAVTLEASNQDGSGMIADLNA